MLEQVSFLSFLLKKEGKLKRIASVTFHLDSETPLFKRAILMSGSRFFVQALPYDAHEENYRQAISALGLENATSDEKIKALLETPGQDLLAKLPPSVLTAPAVDGDMVPSTVTYAQVADRTSNIPKGKQWCRDLLIGDAQYDVSGWRKRLSR